MKLSTQLTLAIVAVALFTAATTGLLIYRNIEATALPRALDRVGTHARLIATELEAQLRGVPADATTQGRALDALVSANLAGGMHPLDGTTEAMWRERLASRFVSELTAKSTYSQYRLVGIADEGREIVRVDRMGPGGAIRVVPDAELQRKGDRDYFTATIALPAGAVYSSPIDLNRENGAIETPHMPTLRVAAPVYSQDSKPFGILIINVDMRSLFASVRSGALAGGRMFVVEKHGDYLVHPDPQQEFGFEFGRPSRIQDSFPQLAGLQSSGVVEPQVVQDRNGESFGVGWATLRLSGLSGVSVVEVLPYSSLFATAAATRDASIIAGSFAVFCALILAVLLARSLTRPLVQMTKAVEGFARDERIAVPVASRGEIGVLARTFARMADDVQAKAAVLKRAIEERSLADEKSMENGRLARGIVDTALDAVVQIDEAGNIIDWNPQAEVIFGWRRDEAVGRNLADLIIPERYRPRHKEGLARFVRSGQASVLGKRFEIEALRRGGKEFKVELSVTALPRKDGYIFNAFLRDLTEKIAAEEQLRQAQKMEAVGQLTGGIAHDFNNLLTVITGTVEILADAVADKPHLASITKLISEAADRGAELTACLLAFARKQPLQPREIDVNALLAEVARLLRPTLGEHVDIELNTSEAPCRALVDPTQLTTALLNLAVNARDAMPKGGRLTLETDHVVLDDDYVDAVKDILPGSYVVIAVSDTGTGIPKALREKVFEPFYSTKEVGKGTGLGLSMVYGFVKQSGGHIDIYSEQGQGSTFRIYLPRVSLQADALDAGAATEPIQGGSETILVVEDDAMVRSSVTTQLRSLGYKTISATNAAEALAMVDTGMTFDLLFTDVIMPGALNGRQLAEEVERRRPGTNVLFTSGYAENAIVHHGRIDPGALLLTKPYRKSDLARMLRRALEAPKTLLAARGEVRNLQTM